MRKQEEMSIASCCRIDITLVMCSGERSHGSILFPTRQVFVSPIKNRNRATSFGFVWNRPKSSGTFGFIWIVGAYQNRIDCLKSFKNIKKHPTPL